MLCSSIFNIRWVLCSSVAHKSILQTSLLHILTSCYSSLARLNILILLCPQSPLPNPGLISGFISTPFCQELHFCSSLQRLQHVFIVLIFISVTSLYQQSLCPERVTTFSSDYYYISSVSAFKDKQKLGQTHNFGFQVCQRSKRKSNIIYPSKKNYNERSILQLPTF